MREYDEGDYNIRRYAPFWRRVIILVTVIIAAPVMMWTILERFPLQRRDPPRLILAEQLGCGSSAQVTLSSLADHRV